MAIQLSPGVSVTEYDLTTVVPAVSSSTGAFAGNFVWGPALQAIPVSDENQLSVTFGAPNNNTAISFMTASSFLAYGNDLRVVRALSANSLNADANTSTTNVQIANKSIYDYEYFHGGATNSLGAFAARYAGALGNSISIDVWDSANTTLFKAWEFAGNFSGPTTTSSYATNVNGANDEIHIIVTDTLGLITGTKGALLEAYPYVSKSSDAIDGNGVSTYYRNVLESQSQYIYAIDSVDYANTTATWGSVAANTTFARAYSTSGHVKIQLAGGTDADVSDGDLINAYDLFENKDLIDISLVITGNADVTVLQHIADNIVTPAGSVAGRSGDAVAFFSPPISAVVNQHGLESTNIMTWLNDNGTGLQRSSSYVVVDSGWKYMYDKYNNVYRWIPLNGDVAGLCAFTDAIRDPWWSPAGYNRGNIKNAVKLAWNPNQMNRDILYPQGVNPVVSFPGNGIILYGDKTLQAKPSAFDRINVRRLFIVLEKAIALAAKYSLFEFNDDFTRAQFISLVAPFLRDVQGRRGITDFKVVCDTTNNTGYVIDNNQFVGDIYIKPARSINFIKLNFIAVGTAVNFSEVVGSV